jgi:squalene-hopene/tetraprenyl-beta-curcumene cyclase
MYQNRMLKKAKTSARSVLVATCLLAGLLSWDYRAFSGETVEVIPAKIKAAVGRAAAFLIKSQNKDGSFGEFGPSVGMTGLAVTALAESNLNSKAAAASLKKGLAFLLKHKQKDGGIYIKSKPYNSYETSIAVLALSAIDAAKYKAEIAAAANYLKGIQDDGSKNPESKGGIGYGSDKSQSNMSTTIYALQALKAAGVKEDEEVWKRAVAFIAHCQNSSEVNDLGYAAVINDGGHIYSPGNSRTGGQPSSKAGKVTIRGKTGWRSYGSMTYAGYLGYVYAKLSSDDPRVKGALRWIKNNYTLDENPCMKGQGLYYYYNTFALAMSARGQARLTLADGKQVIWARDLGFKLVSLQEADGGFTNKADRWHEGSRVICSSFALRALVRSARGLAVRK